MRWHHPPNLLLVIATLLLLLPCVAWTTWPWWSAAALRHVLAATGIELKQVEWQRPRWRHLNIDRISIGITRAAQPVTITAINLTAQYSLSAIQRNRLDRIEVARIDIDVQPAETAVSTPPSTTLLPLPAELLALIPAASLDVRDLRIATPWPALAQWQGHVDFRNNILSLYLADTGVDELALQLTADTTNQIELSLQQRQRDLIRLRNQFKTSASTPDTIQLQGSFNADLSALAHFMPQPLPQLEGSAQASWQGNMPRAPTASPLIGLQGSGALNVQIDAAHARPGLAVNETARIDFASDFTLEHGTVTGTVRRGTGRAAMMVPASIAALFQLNAQKTLPLSVSIQADTPYRVALPARELKMTPANIDVRIADKAGAIDTRASIDALTIQLLPQPHAQLHASIHTPAQPLAGMLLRPAMLDTELHIDSKNIGGTWQWRDRANFFRMKGALQHRLDTNAGTLQAQLQPLSFHESGNYLPALFDHWRWPADLSGGELHAAAALRWDHAGLRADASVDMRKLAGFYDHNLIKGVNGTLQIGYRDRQVWPHTPRLSIDRVDVGVPITEISTTITANARAVTFENVSAQLFGGTVSQARMEYARGRAEQNTVLNIQHLQLDQILALQQNVAGTGTLDGTVPVRLRNGTLSVENAELIARVPGGTLRYRGDPPAGAAANQGLELAFKALQNFQYHTMNVHADYAESGDLLLGVELQGRNPDAKDTPPVNFNLNIRENVPDLLHSLQLGGAISDRIEQRIKSLRKKQQRSSSP